MKSRAEHQILSRPFRTGVARASAASALLILLQSAAPALAQQAGTAPAAGTGRVYLPADFSRFAPRTALDMVEQIPGFSIRGVEERRGFGQGSGNIVVNGRRISGKTNDAITELSRIPADRVMRIEVVDAATLDISGLSGQVANIIVKAGAVKTTFEWRPGLRPGIDQYQPASGSLSVSGSRGPFGFTLGLENTQFAGGGIGPERVVDGSNSLIDYRDEDGWFFGDQPQVSGSLRYESGGGDVGNLNGTWRRQTVHSGEISLRTGAGQLDRIRRFRALTRETLREVGGDYELGLPGGRLKFIGLHRVSDYPSITTVITDASNGTSTGVRNVVDATETESIVRGEYRWKELGGDWQMSIEGAFNSLDNATDFAQLASNEEFKSIIFPNANSRIEEKRAETILSYALAASPRLALQFAAGGEYSNLSQTGPLGVERTFYRPKGSVSAAWKASKTLTVNAKIEREVGQLNFFSFLASVNVLSETSNAGNPDLVPQQSWNLELEANKNLKKYGRIKARVYARFIEDIVDQIPIGDRGESPGNLDSATIHGFQLTSTTPLDIVGWKGAKLDLDLRMQDSAVRDPVLDFIREISVTLRYSIDARLRYDVPRSPWATGLNYFDRRNYDNYRLGEISNLYTPSNLEAFVEHKDVLGLKMRATVANLLGTNETYRRAVHVGRRGTPLAFIERRSREYGPIIQFSISGSL
jgi:hypothetical protein